MIKSLIFYVLRRLFPMRCTAEELKVPLDELQRKCAKYNYFQAALFFLLGPLCFYLADRAIRSLFGGVLPAIAGPIYAIRPDDAIWWVASICPAIGMVALLSYVIFRSALNPEQYHINQVFSDRLLEMSTAPALAALCSVLAAGSLLLAAFAGRDGVFLGRDQFVVVRMWSFHEEHYRYDQVKALQNVWNSKGGEWEFTIKLDGAPDWCTLQESIDPNAQDKALLSVRTGRPIERVVPKQPGGPATATTASASARH